VEKFRTLKKKRRKAKHGFIARTKTHGGRKVLKRRRAEKRRRITV